MVNGNMTGTLDQSVGGTLNGTVNLDVKTYGQTAFKGLHGEVMHSQIMFFCNQGHFVEGGFGIEFHRVDLGGDIGVFKDRHDTAGNIAADHIKLCRRQGAGHINAQIDKQGWPSGAYAQLANSQHAVYGFNSL